MLFLVSMNIYYFEPFPDILVNWNAWRILKKSLKNHEGILEEFLGNYLLNLLEFHCHLLLRQKYSEIKKWRKWQISCPNFVRVPLGSRNLEELQTNFKQFQSHLVSLVRIVQACWQDFRHLKNFYSTDLFIEILYTGSKIYVYCISS